MGEDNTHSAREGVDAKIHTNGQVCQRTMSDYSETGCLKALKIDMKPNNNREFTDAVVHLAKEIKDRLHKLLPHRKSEIYWMRRR
jgi:pyruvate-formate lyase-activating enzyme